MKNFDVLDFYKYMEEHNIILSFKGEMSQEILISIGDMLKEKLTRKETKQQVIKKVFFIFVELAQNVYRYSSEHSTIEDKEIGMGILFIKECETNFKIFAGNVVTPKEAADTTEHCTVINRLSQDELKRFYKEQLKQTREEGKVGAGLGLISIVRKANSPIQAYTTDFDKNQNFLVLSIEVNKN